MKTLHTAGAPSTTRAAAPRSRTPAFSSEPCSHRAVRNASAGGAAPLATCPAARTPLPLRRRRCAAAAEADSAAAAPAPSAPGRMTYRPESYAELVSDAAAAMLNGIEAGVKRMEVEFPPIPTNVDGEPGHGRAWLNLSGLT